MVVLNQYTTSTFDQLESLKGRILYDSTLNTIRYNNSVDYNNFLVSKDSTHNVSGINNLNITGNVNINNSDGANVGITLNGVLVISTAQQINYLNVTPGTAIPTGALVLNANSNLSGINELSVNALTADTISTRLLNLANINTTGNVGINTTALDYGLEVNHSTGDVLRLSYNDNNGVSPTNRVDFQLSPTGTMSMTTFGTDASINITNHNGTTQGLQLAGTLVTSSAVQLNYVNVTPGTADATKALILDGNRDISNINNIITTGYAGINTVGGTYGLEVNQSSGQCLRLTNDDNTGSPTSKCDFQVTATGSLTIIPAGANPSVNISANVNAVSVSVSKQNIANDTVDFPITCTMLPASIPENGLGVGIDFNTLNDDNTIFSLGTLEYYSEDISAGAEYSGVRIRVSNNDNFLTAMTLDSSGVLSCTSLIETSDIRTKENIKETIIDDSVAKILKLDAKTYNYIKDSKKVNHTGFIAQEVKEIFPSVVVISENDDFEDLHQIHYTELIPHLVNCIKDLYKEIEELKRV